MCWAANHVYYSDHHGRSPQWPYWLGPFAAALAHAVVYLVFPPHHKALYEAKKD